MKKMVTVNKVRPGWEAVSVPRRTNHVTRERALKAANQLFSKGR